eukprot:GHVU01207028.1.p3 GENE.GHVU01207028.1~~GHVU01207028.1.p3  ORF type:complete len:105 (-),score=12.92 GHVU01207028.1:158-472(-)
MDANFDIHRHVFAEAFGFTTHIGQKRRGRSDDAVADNVGKNSVDFLFVSKHAGTVVDGLPMNGEGGGDHASILRTIKWAQGDDSTAERAEVSGGYKNQRYRGEE